MATKLKNAAQSTAWYGFSTRVETTVAIEFAASWKPFMKSNASASATSSAQRQHASGRCAATSGVLQDDVLDEVCHVLTPVGGRFEQFVDRLQLDQLADVRLFAEQRGDGGRITRSARDSMRIDLAAELQCLRRIAACC